MNLTSKAYRRLALIVILGLLIPGMACNFPFRGPDSQMNTGLQGTLTIMASTAQTGWTPFPDNDGDTISSPTEEYQPEAQIISGTPVPPVHSVGDDGPQFSYITQPGDTLSAVARRFGVEPEQVASAKPLPTGKLLPAGQEVWMPDQLGAVEHLGSLLPDSEVIYSPSVVDFQVHEFIHEAGGYLSTYRETVKGEQLSGADIVLKAARENSINPRLLLALLEYRSGWVRGQPLNPEAIKYPIGFYVPDYQGLYYELVLTATHLGVGYYGWRSGELTSLTFQDGSSVRVSPGLNAGSVALQALFSKINDQHEWRESLYGAEGFVPLYQELFGDPWIRAGQVEPLIPSDLEQPVLELPFAPGERWSFTGGPHRSWNSGSSRGALDFSPVTGEAACTTSKAWVTASAAGRVTRAEDNVVAVDLDGDGHEGTGWVLVYLHIADQEVVSPEEWVDADQDLGHPSCERGNSTGTHVHLARKYNGEWISTDGTIPYILSGWEVEMGEKSYQGRLINGEQIVTANPGGPSSSVIIRED